MYIIVEGPDFVGKTTQAVMLAEHFEQTGRRVMLTKEPGSDEPICKQIRAMLLDKKNKITSHAALCLFLADRCQHMEQIKVALAEGKVVISDRSSFSSFAYYASELLDQEPTDVAAKVAPLLDFAQQVRPDWCFVCSADFDWCMARAKERPGLDRIESLGQDFHKRVHQFFKQHSITHLQIRMNQAPDKVWFCRSASSNSKEDIHEEIWGFVGGGK